MNDATAEQVPDLSAALARARRPVEVHPRPKTGFRARLRADPRVRSAVPARLALARAVRSGESIWAEEAPERERARRAIAAIVAGTARAGEAEMLARQHLIENQAYEALFWRQWGTPEIDPISSTRLQDALDADRGVLASTCHLGPNFMTMGAVASLGHTPYSVTARFLFETPGEDAWGRRIYHWQRAIRARGERLVYSVGSFPVIQALLEQREIVQLLFDMPGSARTHFLGKPVMLASGGARLAVLSDALVLPMRARRVGHRVWIDVSPPLDPADFAGVEELHRALAAVHERSILELPASLEDPRRAGAWELGAGPDAWTRP